MKKYINSVIFLLILISCLSASYGQEQQISLSDISDKFTKYVQEVPSEIIYIHSDRNEFIAGEEFWFNLYLFDRQSSKPGVRSKIAYVELLNADNTPVAQKRISITDGFGPGQFTIPDSLTTGTYLLRAYTNWMKNFMPENCFMQEIRVYNYLNSKVLKEKIITDNKPRRKVNIAYYPEGGTILSGFTTKIGVRVSDEYDRGLKYEGIIRDEKGDSVTTVKTGPNGFGSFDITPVDGASYNIAVNTERDNYLSFLPGSFPTGLAIDANNTDPSNLIITLNSNNSWREKAGSIVNLFIHTNGNINYSDRRSLTGDRTIVTIPKASLNPGVNQITVFNTSGQPLCERLIFTPDLQNRGLEIIVTSESNIRSKIGIVLTTDNLHITDQSLSNLSISVAPQTDNNYITINDYLLFGTEFGDLSKLLNSDQSVSDLGIKGVDDFLLTAKSNRINWEKILSGKNELNFPVEDEDHYLTGRLETTATDKSDNLIFLSVPGKVAIFQSALTDRNGNFTFKLGINESLNDLVIQPADITNKSSVRIISPFSEKYPAYVTPSVRQVKVIPPYISKWGINYQAGKIFGVTSLNEPKKSNDLQQPKLRFYGKPDRELIMSDYVALPVMSEVFFELLPGVTLKTNRSNYSFSIIDPVDKKYLDNSPALLIDGVIIKDAGMIANLDPLVVEKIDVIKTRYALGNLIFYGIINVITKEADLSSVTLPDYAIRLPYKIFTPVNEFKSPDYSTEVMLKSRIPDFRNTLYWNPSVKTSSDGKAEIEFWTSDYKGEYDVIIQGITINGTPVFIKKRLSLK